MGWVRGELHGHEGYAVALIERESVSKGSRLYRELAYPTDSAECRELAAVQAGCECGWRSPYLPYLRERQRAYWVPYSLILGEVDEERVYQLWKEHADQAERTRAGVAR